MNKVHVDPPINEKNDVKKPRRNSGTIMMKPLSSEAKEILFINFLIESLKEMFALEEEDFVLKTDKQEESQKYLAFNVKQESCCEINVTKRQLVRCDVDHVRNMLQRLMSNSVDIGIN